MIVTTCAVASLPRSRSRRQKTALSSLKHMCDPTDRLKPSTTSARPPYSPIQPISSRTNPEGARPIAPSADGLAGGAPMGSAQAATRGILSVPTRGQPTRLPL
jgi:hypothetical protein